MCLVQAIHYKKYSTASDVWSFGIVLYEIWSIGHKPYEGLTTQNVNYFYYVYDCVFTIKFAVLFLGVAVTRV